MQNGLAARARPVATEPDGRALRIGLVTTAAGRAAVLVPGGRYSTDGPLLMYSGLAVTRRGGHVHPISWNPPEQWAGSHSWVASQVAAAVDEVVAGTGGTAPVVIGKSLGSLAAPLAADRGLPAIWFTPLLFDEPTVAALRRTAAPVLLVGGTADRFWDGEAARSISQCVVEIDGADHGMFVPGELAASAAVLGQVMTAVQTFLDQLVWP